MKNKIFKKITISNDNKKMVNNYDQNYLDLINRYLVFLFLLFSFYSLFIIFYFGDNFTSTILVGVALMWLLLISIKGKTSRFLHILKPSIISVFLVLIFLVSFFYIYTWKQGGVEYFYFSILFALPFFFNYKQDYYAILFIVLVVALSFIGGVFFEMEFLPRSKYIKQEEFKVIQFLNIMFNIVISILNMYFVHRKDELIFGLMKETETKTSTIEDLLKTNNELMKKQIITNNLTEENIKDILDLAETNSSLFLERFQTYFPNFLPDLLKINSNLISSEIYICALIRLNFDTKKIASCTNSSVRAIESRKYRIRKKLGIPSDVNINNFILNI
ncbi:helix-turn-helix transcriptional regulator [Chryseobacterium oryctis]|uniref:Two component regulator three Y domain-containing protein n=1 Tax=Chryseobacterium oryctis TaxID=2952618 RepID=A0ABT3HL17_9FLAO|nr:Two component regulator three Y domain-containing protein [Chryseobacterium oryctis]MCW3160467.1 Two component regulator three Y domain-containing protein [Chryseobacterium oryctis]